MTRDYGAELRALIDAERSKGTYNSRTLADKIVEKLVSQDSELLDGWLRLHAGELLWTMINEIDRRERATVQNNAKRIAAGEAVRDFEQGNADGLKGFMDTFHVVDAEHTRKRLGDLRAPELEFVANGYASQKRSALLKEAFFRALQKRVGDHTVGEVFSEEEIAAMWTNLERL
jgi:hypothetical protein